MSLKEELKELKRQKKAELQNLHHTYVYTKRDVKRATSPDRFIRKHLAPTLGVAAIMGLLLAPRPAARVEVVKEKAAPEAGGTSIGGHVRQLIRNALQQAERLVPPPKGAQHNGDGAAAKPPKKSSAGFMGTVLAALLSRIDIQKVAAELTRQYMTKMQGRSQSGTPAAAPPQVSVADAGTVRPTDYEDLQ